MPLQLAQQFHAFGRKPLDKVLRLLEPPLVRDEDEDGIAFRQLAYVERYVDDLGCKSMLVEHDYIDRDYMEDHSVFYSRSLQVYRNRCQRVHFFTAETKTVRVELQKLLASAIETKSGAEYRRKSEQFSKNYYLGFSVIKPLGGCPVGRTVLKCFDENAGEDIRVFDSARTYTAHVRGAALTVTGLAFQQQDIGVSACATTALWSSLQKARDFEEIVAATPAQITRLASQYTLPFGRPMPSEGLGVDQMCVAIQSLGLAPNLFRVADFETARGYIYSAVRSGFAPVLILKKKSSSTTVYHAVTVAGLKRLTKHAPALIGGSPYVDDRAGDMIALYVHDDRNGPYLRADVRKRAGGLELQIDLQKIVPNRVEDWIVTHLLVPMHSKVRVSFSGLRQIAFSLVSSIGAFGQELVDKKWKRSNRAVVFETWIERGHVYVERLIASGFLDVRSVERFSSEFELARYVGVISLTSSETGTLHVLVDTTSTARNLNFVGVLRFGAPQKYTRAIAKLLAGECKCSAFT